MIARGALVASFAILVFLFAKHVWPTNLPRWLQGSYRVVQTVCDDGVCVRIFMQITRKLDYEVHTSLQFGGSHVGRFRGPIRMIQFQSDGIPNFQFEDGKFKVNVGTVIPVSELLLTAKGTQFPVDIEFIEAY